MTDMQTTAFSGGTDSRSTHLLIPVDATERSHWGIQYALRQQRDGKPVRVTMLFVAVPPDDWRILRFKTESEILRFQIGRGRILLEEAASILRQAGIDVQCLVREGNIVSQILDAAEQCECDAVVLPLPHSRLLKLWSADLVREVIRRAGPISILTVNAKGTPDRSWMK